MRPGWFPLTGPNLAPFSQGYAIPGISVLPSGLAVFQGTGKATPGAIANGGLVCSLPPGLHPVDYGTRYLPGSAIIAPSALGGAASTIVSNGGVALNGVIAFDSWPPFVYGERVVAILGASIAGGTAASDVNTKGMAPLYSLLALEQGRSTAVVNLTIGGNTTTQMVTRFLTDVAPTAPTYVLLVGDGIVNDVDTGIAAAVSISNLQSLIAMTRALGARPVIFTCPPNGNFGSWSAANEANRQTVNNFVRSLVANNELIIDADTFSADLTNPNRPVLKAIYDSGDGLHPNDLGQAAYAGACASLLL